jgi:hypothetical protein
MGGALRIKSHCFVNVNLLSTHPPLYSSSGCSRTIISVAVFFQSEMASLVRRDLPLQPYPKWKAGKMRFLEKWREDYRKGADWTIQHLYGNGVVFEPDEREEPITAIQLLFQRNGKAANDTKNIVSLRHVDGGKGRTEKDGGEVVYNIKAKEDLVTAIYVPCVPNNNEQDLPSKLSLDLGGSRCSTWFRNPSTGLFDGATTEEQDNTSSLSELLQLERREFHALFPEEVNHGDSNRRRIRQENAQRIALERLLNFERNELSCSAIRNCLASKRDTYMHTQSRFIGPYRGHDLWQRMVLLHPCIPSIAMAYTSINLVLDKKCDLVFETVDLHQRWRYDDGINPLLCTHTTGIYWTEEPVHAIAESLVPSVWLLHHGSTIRAFSPRKSAINV